MESFQRCAQSVGGDRDDRLGAAPGGQLEGDPGAEGVSGDVEVGYAKPVQFPLNGVREGCRCRRDPWGERG